MKTLLQGWHFMRILRVLLGVIIIVQGITAKDSSFILIGGLLAAMGFFNIGCGPAGCGIPNRPINKSSTANDIEFEELKK